MEQTICAVLAVILRVESELSQGKGVYKTHKEQTYTKYFLLVLVIITKDLSVLKLRQEFVDVGAKEEEK